MEWLLSGAVGLLMGVVLAYAGASSRYSKRLYDAQCELAEMACEVATLQKQLRAQEQIYSRLERRLVAKFGRYAPLADDEQCDDVDETDLPACDAESHQAMWKIGNAVYFNYEAYLEALENGELARHQGGVLV